MSEFIACRLIIGALLVMDLLCLMFTPVATQARHPGGLHPGWIPIVAVDLVILVGVLIVNLRYTLSSVLRTATLISGIVALASLIMVYAAWVDYRAFLRLLRAGGYG